MSAAATAGAAVEAATRRGDGERCGSGGCYGGGGLAGAPVEAAAALWQASTGAAGTIAPPFACQPWVFLDDLKGQVPPSQARGSGWGERGVQESVWCAVVRLAQHGSRHRMRWPLGSGAEGQRVPSHPSHYRGRVKGSRTERARRKSTGRSEAHVGKQVALHNRTHMPHE